MSISLDDAAAARAANWTIKSVPLGTRLKATTAARRANQPVWQWLTWAVEVADSQQSRNTVGPTEWPTVARANSSNPEGQPRADLDRLIALAALPHIPQWLRRRVHRLLGEIVGAEPPPWRRLPASPRREMLAASRDSETAEAEP